MVEYSLEDDFADWNSRVTFFQKYERICSCCLIDFYTEKLYKLLPVEWNLPRSLETHQLVDIATAVDSKSWCIEFQTFLKRCRNLALKKAPICWSQSTSDIRLSVAEQKGMKRKKQHEVAVMAAKVASVSSTVDACTIIDIGCGQGHLGRVLAHKYNLRVIGVDCCGYLAGKGQHSASELMRGKINRGTGKLWQIASKFHRKKILRYTFSNWSRLCNKSKSRTETLSHTNINDIIDFQNNQQHQQYTSRGSFRSISAWIDSQCDALENLRNILLLGGAPPDSKVVIIGLHACGDLSPTILRLFVEGGPQCAALVNVGCCYHRLTEAPSSLDCVHQMTELSSSLDCNVSHTSRYYHKVERKDFFHVQTSISTHTDGSNHKVDHLENFCRSENQIQEDKHRWGLPMSSIARDNNKLQTDYRLKVCKKARDLACHDNWSLCIPSLNAKNLEKNDDISKVFFKSKSRSSLSEKRLKQIYYRSLLQQILKTSFPDLFNASMNGKLRMSWRKKCFDLSFEDYVKDCITCSSSKPFNENELMAEAHRVWVVAEQENIRQRLSQFIAIRSALAPSIEHLILVDRVLYVKESIQNCECKLISLFDPRISPRHAALIAIRHKDKVS